MKNFFHNITLLLTCFLAFSAMACQADDGEDAAPTVPPVDVDIELHGQMPIIAHRGYWQGDERPRNSLAAFKAALELNIYGSECDIRQTKDGVLVVCHDDKHDGLSISRSTYEELCQHPLANGESLPRLESFIQEFKLSSSRVKLVIEIKDCDIDDLLSMVINYGVADRVLFISFNKKFCNQLVKRGRGPQTFYLNGDMTPMQIKNKGYAGIDYRTSIYDTYPSLIDQVAEAGIKAIVWTPNDKESIAGYISQGVIVTTDRPFYAEGVKKVGSEQ